MAAASGLSRGALSPAHRTPSLLPARLPGDAIGRAMRSVRYGVQVTRPKVTCGRVTSRPGRRPHGCLGEPVVRPNTLMQR